LVGPLYEAQWAENALVGPSSEAICDTWAHPVEKNVMHGPIPFREKSTKPVMKSVMHELFLMPSLPTHPDWYMVLNFP
jgi:hypothetical protein